MNLTKILSDVFSCLNQREKDILIRRFGLEGEEETLEELGNDYNVTRERIRQIQENALNKIIPLIKKNKEVSKIIKQSKKFLKPIGVRRGKTFFYFLDQKLDFSFQEIKIFKFFSLFSEEIIYYQNDDYLDDFYAENEKIYQFSLHLLKKIYLTFLDSREVYPEEKILALILKEIKKHFNINPGYDDLIDFLKILKNIGKNPFNFWGVKNHNFITPRCLKDKIYLIFKLERRPMHFKEIYQKLHQLAKVEDESIHYYWHKTYNPNSIRNELIKHNEFVLIKPGVYVLKND
ncbi:MAG: hypothetical protein KatS3mg096_075 [Candidatus Parcubacteria bacterium]|nr:MAG: hypothetical protein KatS3mg096_075 [Candidatus Parcubacteria bacterium]